MRNLNNNHLTFKDSKKDRINYLRTSLSLIDISNVKRRLKTRGNAAYRPLLTDWEFSYIDSMKFLKRKSDFLSGRLAGKKAVNRLLTKDRVKGEEFLSFNNIEIKRTVTGRPLVFINKASTDLLISITHTEGVAASYVCNKKEFKGIGIDIEKIDKRDKSIIDIAFTTDEIAKFENISENSQYERLYEDITKLWSIKEAVLKSLGVGVNIDLKNIEVVNSNSNDNGTEVRLRDEAKKRFELLGGEGIKVESFQIDEYMTAISWLY